MNPRRTLNISYNSNNKMKVLDNLMNRKRWNRLRTMLTGWKNKNPWIRMRSFKAMKVRAKMNKMKIINWIYQSFREILMIIEKKEYMSY